MTTACKPAPGVAVPAHVLWRGRPWESQSAVLAGRMREGWGHLIVRWARWQRDDVLLVLGCRMQLVGLLQQASGESRALVVPAVDAWLTRVLRPVIGAVSTL